MNADPLYALRGLRFAYPPDARSGTRFQLEIEALDIRQGECVALVGGNGAGKTTLLKLLNGLLEPESGSIGFRGEPLAARRHAAVRAASVLVHQQPYLFSGTVGANVGYGPKVRKADPREIRRIVDEKLALVGLEGFARRRARELSGGEQQRVAIARALALEPEILLLDEPAAHMDPSSVRQVEEVLRRIHRQGTTLIMSSHQLELAYRLADRMHAFDGGRLVAPRETILRGRVARRAGGFLYFAVPGAELRCPDREGDFVVAVLSASDVILSREVVETSAQNRFRGRVTAVRHHGALFEIQLDCGFPLEASITEASRDQLDARPGVSLVATFKASAVRLY